MARGAATGSSDAGMTTTGAMDTSPYLAVWRDSGLRRVLIAWSAGMSAEWAYVTAMLVIAFELGGPVAVGVAGLVRMGPAALAAPLVAAFGGRFRRRTVLAVSAAARCVLLFAAALAIAGGAGLATIFTLAALDAIVGTGIRPAQGALLPQLAADPRQLAAANTFVSAMFIGGIMVGSLLGGFIYAASDPDTVYITAAALFAIAGSFYARLPSGAKVRRQFRIADVWSGFRAAGSNPNLAAVVAFTAFQMLVRGISVPLFVLVAKDAMGKGAGGVGVLIGALGAGGLLGIALTAPLVRRGGGAAMTYGVALIGGGLFLAGTAVSDLAVIIIATIVVRGAFLAAADAAGVTLIQRNADDAGRVRVLGIMESLSNGMLAIGSILAPALVVALGLDLALVVSGLAIPVVALGSMRWFAKLDAGAADRDRMLSLIAAQPTFSSLGLAPLDLLASAAQRRSFAPGKVIVEQGAPALAYFIVVTGSVEVYVDDIRVGSIGPKGGFGEVALLRDTTRTATVRAETDVEVVQIDRMQFIAAVDPASSAAEALTRLADLRLGTDPLRRPRKIAGHDLDHADLRGMIENVPGLVGASAADREALVAKATFYEADVGVLITRIGDRAEVVWILLDGEVELTSGADKVATLSAGAVIGDAAAADDCPLDGTAMALGTCRLAALEAAAYRQALRIAS